MLESPFSSYSHLILGHYRMASYLRAFVLSMVNGTDHPVGLSHMAVMDDEHFRICLELLSSYHEHGDRDPAFRKITQEIFERIKKETSAEQRDARFELWLQDVELTLYRRGVDGKKVLEETEFHFQWYSGLYDAGSSPDQAVDWSLEFSFKRMPKAEI